MRVARPIAWFTTFTLMIFSVLALPSIGRFLFPFALASLAIAAWISKSKYGGPVPIGRYFGITVSAILTVMMTVYAVTETQSNECQPGLPYPCSDSHSEYIWATIAVIAAAATVVQIYRWTRDSEKHPQIP